MNKALFIACAVAWAGMVTSSFALKTEFHGDFNNRFQLYNNHQGFFNANARLPQLNEAEDTIGEIKYRLWTIVGTDDDAVKGVYAIELGAVRFGRTGSGKSQGGSWSGDGVNIETRWAYTDFALADARVKIGLQPWKVNDYVWSETASGVRWEGKQPDFNYVIGWARGKEFLSESSEDDFFNDSDAVLARVDLKPAEGTKTGVFLLYQRSSPGESTPQGVDSENWRLKSFGDVDYDFITVGIDGSWKQDEVFAEWDLMYQNGSFDNVAFTDVAINRAGIEEDGTPNAVGDFDLSAFFGRLKLGTSVGPTKVYYLGYYATGDDSPNDTDFDAFLTTDVDIADSIVIQEGVFTDDNYHTESPYLLDKGLILNKLGVDHKTSDKVTVGGALLYILTAEDIAYIDDAGAAQADNSIGFEIDAYVSYKIYENLELALNAGYLISGDAMDYYEVTRNGSADEDVFVSTARARYKF